MRGRLGLQCSAKACSRANTASLCIPTATLNCSSAACRPQGDILPDGSDAGDARRWQARHAAETELVAAEEAAQRGEPVSAAPQHRRGRVATLRTWC